MNIIPMISSRGGGCGRTNLDLIMFFYVKLMQISWDLQESKGSKLSKNTKYV